MSSFDRFPKAKQTLFDGMSEGVAPGMVAGVAIHGAHHGDDDFSLIALGKRRLALHGLSTQPMEVDTVFDFASVSKVVATATLFARLVDRGFVRYEDPVRKFIPEFLIPDATIQELLAHTAGLPAWAPFFEKIRDYFGPQSIEIIPIEDRQKAMRKIVLSVPPDRVRNVKAVYSDLTFMTLGFIAEEVLCLPFDLAVKRHLWTDMGLETGNQGLHYNRIKRSASMTRIENYAATEACPWRKTVLQGQVHDDNCYTMGGYSGHAGVFGRARDLLSFGSRMLDGFISPPVLGQMWSRVQRPENCERTPGWDTPSGEAPAFGNSFSKKSVGHLGFTGTSFWIDPENGLVITLLTNRVHPNRDNILIRAFRNRFHNALARDLGLIK